MRQNLSPEDILTKAERLEAALKKVEQLNAYPLLVRSRDIAWLIELATYPGEDPGESNLAFKAYQACSMIAGKRRETHGNLAKKVLEYRINRTSGYPPVPTERGRWEQEEENLEALAG